jgi:signal peptidase I
MPSEMLNGDNFLYPEGGIDIIETIKSVLESGRFVELPATGYSMFPTLRPGDRVLVKPVIKGEMPETGSIVVFRDNNQLIIHRLIKIFQNEEGNDSFEARGDSRSVCDKILPVPQITGVAISYKRNGKEHYLKSTFLRAFHYDFNQCILWIFFKMKKLQYFFKSQASADEPE